MLRSTLVLLLLTAAPASAQLAPPSVRIARPFGVAPGESIALEVRGANLDRVAALAFDDPRIQAEGLELAKPDGNDARLGRKLTATLRLPADLAPGPLAFRLLSPRGISNPATLRVGRSLPTSTETEPNDQLRKAKVVALPAAIEGAIEPGDDVDLFAVELRAGETLAAETIAARGGSALDALLTVFGPDGRALASDDDTFGKDAAVGITAPVSGRYVVQLQDANGKNRDNNIEQKLAREYRLEIGRFPLVTSAFPAGARRGEAAELRLLGANLPVGSAARFAPDRDAPPGDISFRVLAPLGASNPFPLRVGEFPETAEHEPNDEPAEAATVVVPSVINGVLTVAKEGDIDLFRLKAAPGREGIYRITAYAARIGSPADPVLTVLDARGEPLAEDDDKLGRDARLERAIDSAEGILLSVRDYFSRGGPNYVYRVEVEPIGRCVTVLADLGAGVVPRGGSVALPITLDRRGDEGPVTVLAGALPEGLSAAPVTLPAKAKTAFLIVTARSDAPLGLVPLRLTARDLPSAVEFDYLERWGTREAPKQVAIEPPAARLVVTEPAPLGLSIEPGEIRVPPGGTAALTVTLDRRGDAAKKGVKLRFLAPDGTLAGLNGINVGESSVAADAKESKATVKADANAAPRRVLLSVRAWFDDGPEFLGVSAAPVTLIVLEPSGK